MKVEKEVRDAIKEDKAVLGTKSVIRGIKAGRLVKVIHASNIPGSAIKDLNHNPKVSPEEGLPRTIEWMKKIYCSGES